MSCLRGDAIKERLRSTDLQKRLVISPLLDEEEQIKVGQASVDVRLGFEFALVTASAFGAIDEFQDNIEPAGQFSALYRKEYIPFGRSLVVHPHQFMLATTLEYIRLPPDLMSYVVGRSTWGRLGLIVATAVGIHPGFSGSLTLELRNLGETPLTLYPGQVIAQLFFHTVYPSDGALADPGQYGGSVDIIPQRISSTRTKAKLQKLIKGRL